MRAGSATLARVGKTVELDIEIYTFDIDFAGHVSNISYIRWLEIGRLRLLTDVGLPTESLMGEGVVPVVFRTEIDYLSPLKLGEPVHLSLHITELRAATATLAFRITSHEQLAAKAVQHGVFLHADSGRPRRIAPEVRARFTPYVDEDPDPPDNI